MTQTILLVIALIVAGLVAVSYYWNNKWTKILVVTLFVFLANAVYFSLDGVKGWPAEEPTDVKGMLASVVIVNPTPDDDGGIYISLFPTTIQKWYEYVYPRTAPKTYFVEFSNDRAAKFELAKKAMEEGKEVRINGIPPKNNSNTGESQEGEEGQNNAVQMILDTVKKLFPREGDTYKPITPNDVEILTPSVPPEKGTN